MDRIGDLMQDFYLSLSSNDTAGMVEGLRQMEDALEWCSSQDANVVSEIVSNCEKKIAQYLRSLHSESVRNMISSCRKQLRSKAALAAESSYQHGQRHLNAMVELLGGWSNIVAELAQLDISDDVLRLCVSPLHTRVAETAFDCFNEFKDDKNIDSWYEKAQRVNMPSVPLSSTAAAQATAPTSASRSAPPSSSSSLSFNLSTLDYIISQLSAMRLLVCQYQFFLEQCGLGAVLAAEGGMGRWREVDGVYVVLEGAYLSRAVHEAVEQCRDKSLLEVQRDVWVLQAVEDVFFLLNRVISRTLDLSVEAVVISVCNRAIELMDREALSSDSFRQVPSSAPASVASGGGDKSRHSASFMHLRHVHIFEVLSRRSFFLDICSVQSRADSPNFGAQNDRFRTPHKALAEGASRGTDLDGDLEVVNRYANNIGADLAVGTMALAEAAGGWLAAFTSPSSGSGVNQTALKPKGSTELPLSSPPRSGTHAEQPPSFLSSALISALEMNSGAEGESLQEVWEQRTLPLPLRDAAVYLNSLCTATLSIAKIRDLVRSCKENGGMPSLGIVLQELDRCRGQYQYLVSTEINITLAHRILPVMEQAVEELLRRGGAEPLSAGDSTSSTPRPLPGSGARSTANDGVFVISGEEADGRADSAVHNVLTKVVTGLLGQSDQLGEVAGEDEAGEFDESTWVGYCQGLRSLLTGPALYEFLSAAAADMNDLLLESILGEAEDVNLVGVGSGAESASGHSSAVEQQEVEYYRGRGYGVRCNEWGALLLYDQVTRAVQLFDEGVVVACDDSVRAKFASLTWSLKVLTLDKPADIKKFNMPVECKTQITAPLIRRLLACRVDFSRDAIMKINLDSIVYK